MIRVSKNVVIDTSAVIAVIFNEPEKQGLIKLTEGRYLLAPASLHWEVGNAFSAMFKQKRISLKQALDAVKIYETIPIQFIQVDLQKTLEIAHSLQIYAYDAYLLRCALMHKAPILTLDAIMKRLSQKYNIKVLEV